jgi:hypothetical protein
MPTHSPTLGLGHLQFEAMLTTARLSANRNDFALIAMLGLLGLRIFDACAAYIADLSEEHGSHIELQHALPPGPPMRSAIHCGADGRCLHDLPGNGWRWFGKGIRTSATSAPQGPIQDVGA